MEKNLSLFSLSLSLFLSLKLSFLSSCTSCNFWSTISAALFSSLPPPSCFASSHPPVSQLFTLHLTLSSICNTMYSVFPSLFLLSCQTLVEYAGRWRIEENPLPLVEVYSVALLSYAHASAFLSTQCESVSLVPERLSL